MVDLVLFTYGLPDTLLAECSFRINLQIIHGFQRLCFPVYFFLDIYSLNPLSANPTKMVKHTQTILQQFADELFECV